MTLGDIVGPMSLKECVRRRFNWCVRLLLGTKWEENLVKLGGS